MSSVRKELLRGGFVLAVIAAAGALLFSWKTFAMPSLSAAFLIDGNAETQIQNLLLIMGIMLIVLVGLIVWITILTVKVFHKS